MICLIFLTVSNATAQNLKTVFLYAGPTFSKNLVQLRESTSAGQVIRSNNNYWRARFNLGAEISINLKDNWALLTDFNFQHKGVSREDLLYDVNGTQYNEVWYKHTMIFLMGTVALEKQLELKKPKNRLAISAGAFYGHQLADIPVLGGARRTFDDRGVSIGVGWLKKNLFCKLVYEMGLVDVFTEPKFDLETRALSIRIGYVFF